MWYTWRGSLDTSTALPLSTTYPTRAVDGLLWWMAKFAPDRFRKRAVDAVYQPGIAGSQNRASAIDHPIQSGWSMAYSWWATRITAGAFKRGGRRGIHRGSLGPKPRFRYLAACKIVCIVRLKTVCILLISEGAADYGQVGFFTKKLDFGKSEDIWAALLRNNSLALMGGGCEEISPDYTTGAPKWRLKNSEDNATRRRQTDKSALGDICLHPKEVFEIACAARVAFRKEYFRGVSIDAIDLREAQGW